MKFEKLDDTKIKIILTIKDLELYNISDETVFDNSSSSQQLLQSILIQAEKEVGFETDDSQLLVEALLSPNQEYIFTITKLIDSTSSTQDSFIFKFDSFDDFVALCTFLNNISDLNLNEFSKNFSLILYNNTYYLYDSNIANYTVLLDYMKDIFSEFGVKISNSNHIDGLLNEYGKVIFKTNAIVNCILNFV